MSEGGDVSLIRDEDVLRRMWQQTEDFSRKKEIRAHMYRLREERLRNLYSPEPPAAEAKGCEFTSAQGHVKSFADQTFQSMKSKEVRDAGSPPKEFTYRGQDLKELSNAGWNVESENKTTDDGHTHVKTVQANIEGQYDVEGGRGQFAAIDQHKQAVTEYHDDNTSLKRNESSSNTAAHEQVMRQTDDGTHFSSTSSSSTATSKFQQVSSTKHEAVPYVTNDDYDLSRQTSFDTNRNEDIVTKNTNRNEDFVTKKTVTNEFEQTLRKNDISGELISKKIDYPDDNTRVIVETRLLPDGTRVTSTRREFRAPVVQSSRSEHHSQQTRNEKKTYHTSSQKISDTRESSSNKTQRNIDNYTNNIVDSQKIADDYDFKTNQQILSTKNDNVFQEVEQQTNNRYSKKSTDDTNNDVKQYSHEVQEHNTKQYDHTLQNRDKQVHHITKEKIETEVVERKTTNENYQSTYQTDYSQKKISHEWSPTHQAWASTLRADTPVSTRPSTRASSPGSRTFQSSTSSLRSSVSPDKVSRKPPSRGSSPSKVDRFSPTRIVSDKYSGIHSTHSVSETKTTRYKSPDSRPPHGSSPTRTSYSPDRKPQRSSMSPEKRSEPVHRPRESPDNKPPNKSNPKEPGYKRSSTSPEKKSIITTDTDTYSDNTIYTSTQLRQSPPRKPSDQCPEPDFTLSSPTPYRASPEKKSPHSHTKNNSPTRRTQDDTPTYVKTPNLRETSPSKSHPGGQNKISPKTSPDRQNQQKHMLTDHYPSSRPSSVSPERKPGYTKPTDINKSTKIDDELKKTPTKSFVNPNRKCPEKMIFHENKLTKEDHYKFIDEATKMYTRTDKVNIKENTDFLDSKHPRRDQSPSSLKQSPTFDTPDYCQHEQRPVLRKDSRSPSPPKGPVTFTEDYKTHTKETEYVNISTHKEYTDDTQEITQQYKKRKSTSPVKETTPVTNPSNLNKDKPNRETSPTKFGTYDKKRRQSEEKVTKVKTADTEDDTLTRNERPHPQKNSYPTSPSKKSPRNSVSPVKYKNTTDFIATERITEEINKTNVTKEHPRQLITPSTSPTRKPKADDTAPSTGQSSPTTSVSGFVYFSSPRHSVDKTIVTDLDDHEYTEIHKKEKGSTIHQRPESLDVKRSPSPSKIPCRSPSPDKRISPSTENIPRKSSLKKPSNYNKQVSPAEKPPSSFRVSPEDEPQELIEHTVIKKDRADLPVTDTKTKPKPPLERRETYEERCRKILGMMDEKNTKDITKKSPLKEPTSNTSSPNGSPCISPSTKESSFAYLNKDKVEVTKRNDEFLIHEREQINKENKTTPDEPHKTVKIPSSRGKSPTKLQDIIIYTEVKNYDLEHMTEKIEKDNSPTTIIEAVNLTQIKSPSNETKDKFSPNNNRLSPKMDDRPKQQELKPTRDITNRQVQSPDKETGYIKPTSIAVIRQETYDIEEDKVLKKSENEHSTDSTFSSPIKTIRQDTYDIEESKVHKQTEKPHSPQKTRDDTGLAKRLRSPEKQNKKPTTTVIRQETYDVEESQVLEDIERSHFPQRSPKDTKPSIRNLSPEKQPGYMKPTSATMIRQETYEVDENEMIQKSVSSRKTSKDIPNDKIRSSSPKIFQQPKQSRSPSPKKHTDKVEFLVSEREQEILQKVQKSLRKLSPDRTDKPSSRSGSPSKSTASLQDLDITPNNTTNKTSTYPEDRTDIEVKKTTNTVYPEKPTDKDLNEPRNQKASSTPTSRNISPVKKTVPPVIQTKGALDSPKSRSISPKKPTTSFNERPQSPQVPKASGIKPKEPVSSYPSRKPASAIMSPTKSEKTIITTEIKKNTTMNRQNSFTKTTSKTPSKVIQPPVKHTETEMRRMMPKSNNRDNTPSKKEPDSKVIRTSSDVNIKYKKSSPQRMKSKPEIQVSDTSTTRIYKQTITNSRLQKPAITIQQSKLPSKPKSATALNTSTDDDDIIIDVQQAKSSRENSPDRICPTPINLTEDVGTPRFPDEVNEPDDELRERAYNTIHETETIVDDIVEICEDDELFVKRNDQVDITEHMKSDECLLTVTEKVNKFAKGPRNVNDNRSPTRRIVDEYDTNTTYQDDYTKLSVNDKAHLFVETAENVKSPKRKPVKKLERPDLTNVDESLKSDDCLLSVSDKVNKFVKSAEQFLTETSDVEEKDKKIKEQHEIIMKNIVQNIDDECHSRITVSKEEEVSEENYKRNKADLDKRSEKRGSFTKETTSSHAKAKDYSSPNLKPSDKMPTIKITTLRSSEAVKKAKAMFENIASTTQKSKEMHIKTTKLTDIGVLKKSPKTDSTVVLQPSVEDGSPNVTDIDSEVDAVAHRSASKSRQSSKTLIQTQPPNRFIDEKLHNSPSRLTTQSPEVPRTKSPMRQYVETTTKSGTSRYQTQRAGSPYLHPENETPTQEKIPGYLRPTMTSQIKEETKAIEEADVSSRRGSGKFGVELRRTSVERSTVSSERRRSVEHHQPCIEDIFDIDLLEQMLEKVMGYEQRRRIRAQIRIAKKRVEDQSNDTHYYTKTNKQTTITVSRSKTPDHPIARSPERQLKSQKPVSPDRQIKLTPQKSAPDRSTGQKDQPLLLNGQPKEQQKNSHEMRRRQHSPEKTISKSVSKTKSPTRQPSPDKKIRTMSPSKTAVIKPKSNRFNEYASAYMKKAGMNEKDKSHLTESKTKKVHDLSEDKIAIQVEEKKNTETTHSTVTPKTYTERRSSKDAIEVIHVNGKRSPSPEKKRSPDRRLKTPTDRLREKSPSPVLKRQESDTGNKETTIKTVFDVEKKTPPKSVQEEKPSWVTNRNLKKITSETRTFSSKKIENEKPKYRAPSPSKVISKPIDVITSSYGPGPIDADGKPLFGIKALRNGATNFQVKGTVIRQEFHSRNGGEPEGSVSVTAYSSSPEELEKLLQVQGERPSRLHGLAAITTTKKFGGGTGNSFRDVHTREERAALDQFTHSDRKVIDSRVEDITDFKTSNRSEETMIASKCEEIMLDDREEQKTESKRNRITAATHDRIAEKKKTEDKRPRGQKIEERRERTEKMERREDKKTVRQSSVKSLTEKYIKSASESTKSERSTYPKAGLILRTATLKDSVSSDSSAHAGLARTDSEHSLASVEDQLVSSTIEREGGRTVTTDMTRDGARMVTTTSSEREGGRTVTTSRQRDGGRVVTTTTTTTRRSSGPQEKSFLDSSSKVTGVQDILTRMKNADIVIQDGDTTEDSEARALLNKFLGATVLMAGMQGYVTEQPAGKLVVKQETVRSSSTGGSKISSSVEEIDLEQCWDERALKKLLDECTDYEQRRRLRARIRTLMAEQEACATAVTEALAAAGESTDGNEAREEEEVTTVTSSVRRNSSEKTVSSSTTTKTSKVIESMTRPAPKPVSPFTKFRQLEKQNSTNSPNSPKTPQSPGSPSQPFFKFTDPALQASALTIKERLLQWCRDKTRDYENVKLENFSTSWADGLAFCALLHHFLPDAFDYSKLTPDKRRHNFTLAFKVADEKAGIYPLLDVDDMVAMRKPDWKCVFTYVQSIHRRFKDQN